MLVKLPILECLDLEFINDHFGAQKYFYTHVWMLLKAVERNNHVFVICLFT